MINYVAVYETYLPHRPTPEREGRPIRVVRKVQIDGSVLWAVQYEEYTFRADQGGGWEVEGLPSSQGKDHATKFRFRTLEEAWATAIEQQKVLDIEYQLQVKDFYGDDTKLCSD